MKHRNRLRMSSEIETRKAVLCVGNAVVDFINVVNKFPTEDSDQIGLNYYWQRGGNATNNCTVLSMLDTSCEFMGVLAASGTEASWLKDDFRGAGIVTDHCVTFPGQCPVATSIISTDSGSRTILGFPRSCPELTHAEFREKLKGDFSAYSWLHFELRIQTKEVASMMNDVRVYNKDACVQLEGDVDQPVILSVEVENPDSPQPELAMVEADYVFISKDFAQSRDCKDIRQALEDLYTHCRPGSVLICAWGDQGAGARLDEHLCFSPAKTGKKVLDTLGAGDTFNAGFIHATLKQIAACCRDDVNSRLQRSLDFACHLAGYKCSIYGYHGLRDCPVIV